MKRFSSALLSLLLLLNLTACGAGIQGADSASISVAYGSDSYAFLPEVESDHITAVIPDGDVLNGNEAEGNSSSGKSEEGNRASVDEDGWYDSKEEVALYLYLYGELPGNYVTKQEAQDAGWNGGNVERYTGEGTAIGGSYFGNYEGLLPREKGRTYAECDIDTVGENARGSKRIIYSNDGLIYYTEDHYESFELLYGAP